MKTKPTIHERRIEALFGPVGLKPREREIWSHVATWPADMRKAGLVDRLGNFARVIEFEGVRDVRNHPAVEWLLETIVPALCERRADVLRAFADALDAVPKGSNLASRPTAFMALQVACEWAGHELPFNSTGEPLAPDDDEDQLPETIYVSQSESALRRAVEKRLKLTSPINPGSFTRLLDDLQIVCRKAPKSGGRGRKVLPKATTKQKTKG